MPRGHDKLNPRKEPKTMPNETKHTPGPWRAEMEMEEPEEVGECPWHEACRERVTDCGWTNDKCDKDDDE